MDMRDKFEALYAALIKEQTGMQADPEKAKALRVGKFYEEDGVTLKKMSGAWLGFQLAAAAVKRGEDIQ